MTQPLRSGAQPVPLAIVVGAQKLASGSSTCAGGDNVWPVSTLVPESWWVHGDLDYMHARYCSPVTGRFLGVDEAQGKIADPQTWNRYSYVTGNPLRYVDPNGKERAEIMLNIDVRELTSGKISREEYMARQNARGVGALIGVGLVVGAVATPEAAAFLAVRFPALFATGTTILAGLAEQPMPASVTGPLLQVSSRNLKHIGAHLSEFQALDKNATVRDVAALGQRIAADVKNFVRTHGGGKLFEATVKIGGKVVKVRVFVGGGGGVRTVFIPEP